MFDSATAGNFHADNGHTFDIVVFNNFRQFLRVVHGVQLRTADQCDAALDKVAVEVRIGKGGAVCSDQQVRIVKIRCVDRQAKAPEFSLRMKLPMHPEALRREEHRSLYIMQKSWDTKV